MISLCKYNEVFLELSWSWLNDPEIKRLTNTPDFTKESQRLWFDNLNNTTGYFIWGLKIDKTPVGACGLKNLTNYDCEYWGYIGVKEHWGKGYGDQIILLLTEKAKILKVSSIWLKVRSDNQNAINLYKKHSFVIEKEDNTLLYMRKIL